MSGHMQLSFPPHLKFLSLNICKISADINTIISRALQSFSFFHNQLSLSFIKSCTSCALPKFLYDNGGSGG